MEEMNPVFKFIKKLLSEEEVEEEEEAILSKFKPIELFCPSSVSKSDLWVFWSKDEEAVSSVLGIQNHIETALCSIQASQFFDVLVQFWAPTTTMVGEKRLLATSQQPFAFSDINKDLLQYRKNCGEYKFEDGDGVIGRVFQNQLPEFSPEVSYYSLKEHPLRDLAVSCGITRSWAFPIFHPSRQSCVGVLEFLSSIYTCTDAVTSALKLASLVTINAEMILKQIQEGKNYVAETQEIKGALQQVCKAHGLSFACLWGRCKDGIVSDKGDFVVSLFVRLAYDCFDYIKAHLSLKSLVMRVGQGLVGNAFISDKPYLCTDTTQLSLIMGHVARELSFTGCITICLQSAATRNRDYVLQFYLPITMNMTYGINFHQFFSSVVATLKRLLKNFEPVVIDPGDKTFADVEMYSVYSDVDSMEFMTPTILTENELGVLQNDGEVLQTDFPGPHLDMGELTDIGGDSVHLQPRGKSIVIENNCLEKKSSVVLEEKRLEKKSKTHNQKENSCSYETLKQHFGKKLEDAAESLGVSRSTVKRWCRENNINRWPFPKRRKVTSLLPIPTPINEPIQGNVEPISRFTRKDPSSYDALTELAPKRTMGTVMVKAKYKNDFIKFKISFSSRMIDLLEKVTLRLRLNEGTFTIKYLDVDGDYILIMCDEDLQVCINSLTEGDEIKMLIEPLAVTLIV